MFLEKNLNALKLGAGDTDLIALISNTEPPNNLAFYETESGDYTLGLMHNGNEVLLHHPQGAMLEAAAICDPESNQFHPGLRSKHLILGLGLGYVLDHAYRHSNGHFYVYEPNVPLLRFVLENVDLSESLSNNRVQIATTADGLISKLRKKYINGEVIDVLITNGYATVLADDIAPLTDQLIQMAEEKQSNLHVGLQYHEDWLRQFFQNLPHLPETLPFDQLIGQFPQKPAVIISSGPSLDRALPTLARIQDHVLTFAVGGALRPLLAGGIEPDFALFLDFMGPKQQLTDLPGSTENTTFLLGPFSEGKCFEVPAKGRYLTALKNYGAYADWLSTAQQTGSCRIESGATVSIMAINAAIAMGCNPIILVGQDLAFQEDQYYAGGVRGTFEDNCLVLESSDTMVGRKIPLREVHGWHGEMLKTGEDYYAFLQHFETLAFENNQSPDGVKLYNASSGGAFIQGFEHLTLNDIGARHAWQPLDKTIQKIPISNYSDDFRQALIYLRDQIDHITAQAKLLEGILTAMLDKPLTEWATLEDELAPRYRQARAQLAQGLTDAPFLEYALLKEIWALQETYRFDAHSLEEQHQNIQADHHYMRGIYNKLQGHVRPWIETALSELKTPHENQSLV